MFGKDELEGHKAGSYISGTIDKKENATNLVELVAEVYWVDVITFQIREHYDL